MKVDKNSFYMLIEGLFNKLYNGEYNLSHDIFSDMEKVDPHDYRYCVYEKYQIENKKTGNVVIEDVAKTSDRKIIWNSLSDIINYYDNSVITTDDMKKIFADNIIDFPFFTIIPGIINCVAIPENMDDDVLNINPLMRDIICDSVKDYVKAYDDTISSLEEKMFDSTSYKDNNGKIRSRFSIRK